jgi:hypothetical protein
MFERCMVNLRLTISVVTAFWVTWLLIIPVRTACAENVVISSDTTWASG